jgi:hypothetical protein
MKYYLKSALTIFLIFAYGDMHAQVNSGYIIGLNLSTMTLKASGKSFEPGILKGIHFGRIVKIPVKGSFNLQTGLLLSAKGSVYKIDTAEFFISPIFVEVPVNAEYSFGSDLVKISMFAGPYFAYGIGGNMESGGDLQNINFGTGDNSDIRPFDIGLNFGAGLNIKGFQISAQYELGLANLSPSTEVDSEMKSTVIGISLTSFFSGK